MTDVIIFPETNLLNLKINEDNVIFYQPGFEVKENENKIADINIFQHNDKILQHERSFKIKANNNEFEIKPTGFEVSFPLNNLNKGL